MLTNDTRDVLCLDFRGKVSLKVFWRSHAANKPEDHVLTPGRYVGAEPQKDDGEPFEAKMTQARTVARLCRYRRRAGPLPCTQLMKARRK